MGLVTLSPALISAWAKAGEFIDEYTCHFSKHDIEEMSKDSDYELAILELVLAAWHDFEHEDYPHGDLTEEDKYVIALTGLNATRYGSYRGDVMGNLRPRLAEIEPSLWE